jgi:uncharacterized protein (DUF1330 family)
MKTYLTASCAMLIGIAIGGFAVQGLNAQGKPKAWSITETEILDAAAVREYVPLAQAALKASGARIFNTGGGKVVALVSEAPKRIAINEFDSLEQAQAFYNSAARKDLTPKREKGLKVVRQFIIEAAN